jgi:hypothetical protein
MDQLTPGVSATGIDDLVLHKRDGVEEKLADKGEGGGVARWKAVLSDGGEEFSEDMIDVGGGEEFARRGFGKQRAERFGLEELAFGAGVEDTESGVILAAQHAAFAAVGELKLAKMRIIGSGAFLGHGSSFVEAMKQGSKEVRKSERGWA